MAVAYKYPVCQHVDIISGERCPNRALFGNGFCAFHEEYRRIDKPMVWEGDPPGYGVPFQTSGYFAAYADQSHKKCAYCGNFWVPDQRWRCASCGAPYEE